MVTTLSDKQLFASFLKTIKRYEKAYASASPEKKQELFQKMANYLSKEIGIYPPPRVVNSSEFDNLTVGGFDNKENQLHLNTKRLKNKGLQNFRQVAALFYHEMRHAEQSFRATQYYYQVTKKIPKNEKIEEVNKEVRENAQKTALPDDREGFAKIMYQEYNDEATVYEQRVIERDSFALSFEAYRILGENPRKWYPTAYDVARPAIKRDLSNYDIILLPNGQVQIDNQKPSLPDITQPKPQTKSQTKLIQPTPIKKENDKSLGNPKEISSAIDNQNLTKQEAFTKFLQGFNEYQAQSNQRYYENFQGSCMHGLNKLGNEYISSHKADVKEFLEVMVEHVSKSSETEKTIQKEQRTL